MFSLSFSEILVIALVALVVLGPERLPVVAKSAGRFYGKARHMIDQVKSDIERETELSELKKLKDEALSTVQEVQSSLENEVQTIRDETSLIANDVKKTASDAVATVDVTEVSAAKDEEDVQEEFEEEFDDEPDYSASYEADDTSNLRFQKRWKSGPSVDDLVDEITRLKAELGDRSTLNSGASRHYVPRSRTNRVRIYR